MAASTSTINAVVDAIVDWSVRWEIGPDKVYDLLCDLRKIDGNSSFRTTVGQIEETFLEKVKDT